MNERPKQTNGLMIAWANDLFKSQRKIRIRSRGKQKTKDKQALKMVPLEEAGLTFLNSS